MPAIISVGTGAFVGGLVVGSGGVEGCCVAVATLLGISVFITNGVGEMLEPAGAIVGPEAVGIGRVGCPLSTEGPRVTADPAVGGKVVGAPMGLPVLSDGMEK